MCVFNGFFMRLGPEFSRFGLKDISCRVRNRMLDKIVFRQSHVVFFFFFTVFLPSACLESVVAQWLGTCLWC